MLPEHTLFEPARAVKQLRPRLLKVAAKKCGVSVDEYVSRKEAGEKFCGRCRRWKHIECFGSDQSRYDKRDAKCLDCRKEMHREAYVPVPPDERKPMGPPRNNPRDGDKQQARHLINLDIRQGKRPSPNDLHCARCGHKGEDRRHEYHHHMGYNARHHYDVIPLCSACHHEEH